MAALGLASMCLLTCTAKQRPGASQTATSPPAATSAATPPGGDNGAVIARPGSPPAAEDIPACFQNGEPQTPPDGERTETFQPLPAAVRSTPAPDPAAGPAATPRPTPIVARIAASAAFSLYAIDAAVSEFAPVLLRELTAPAGAERTVSLFSLQYRLPAQRGGGFVIVLSSPSPGTQPLRDDLDDGLDAVRLLSRLAKTPRPGDPLADPGAALRKLGCPARERVTVTLEGAARPTELTTWPGAPDVQFLRAEEGTTEITLESGGLDRAALLALAPRLVSLQLSPRLTSRLQDVFGGLPAKPRPATSATAPPGH